MKMMSEPPFKYTWAFQCCDKSGRQVRQSSGQSKKGTMPCMGAGASFESIYLTYWNCLKSVGNKSYSPKSELLSAAGVTFSLLRVETSSLKNTMKTKIVNSMNWQNKKSFWPKLWDIPLQRCVFMKFSDKSGPRKKKTPSTPRNYKDNFELFFFVRTVFWLPRDLAICSIFLCSFMKPIILYKTNQRNWIWCLVSLRDNLS